jgi:hypothetical protein
MPIGSGSVARSVKRWATAAKMSVPSMRAKPSPMHKREPPPKGKYAKGGGAFSNQR